MNRLQISRLGPPAALVLLTSALALTGCFNPFSPRIAPILGTSKPPPVPSSAVGVLRLFEWCYNNKATAEYREIFTDDYRFLFSPLDSAGAEYRGTPFTREDELISTTQLFVGGSATEPPASSIRLTLDKNLFVYPDPNYPWDRNKTWHSNIRTQVGLIIQTSDGSSIEISGAANFYMVRGDSALIPEELRLRGFGPDTSRWYIRRWDDETAQPEGGAFASRPAGPADLSVWRAGQVEERSRPAAPPGLRRDRSPASLDELATVASWGAIKVYFRRAAASPNQGVAARP